MAQEEPYPASLSWNEGEADQLLASALSHPDLSFYVSEEEQAEIRAQKDTRTVAEWEDIFCKGGFYARVASVYAPKDVVLAHFERTLKEVNQYWTVGVALARFGEEALHLVIAQAHRVAQNPSYAGSWLPELAPVDAAEIAPGIARLLSEKKLDVKRGAKEWLLRHPEAARAGLAAAPASERKHVEAALKALASGGSSAGTKATKGAKAAPTHEHVGWVYFRDHHATPLVVGDLDVMRDWKGEAEPRSDSLSELPKGAVATIDLELQAPNVFVARDGKQLALLAARRGNGRSLLEEHETEDLLGEIAKPSKKGEQVLSIENRSGALVLSIAYQAPKLPKKIPKKAVYEEEQLIVPAPAGRYEIFYSNTETMLRAFIQKVD